MAAIASAEELKKDSRITKESILESCISDIDKLEKNVKSAKLW
jgi:hypothetical protein